MTDKIYLDKEFDKFWKKIENGENFAFMRNADGERAIMMGKAVAAQEGNWKSPNFVSKLGQDIYSSLMLDEENVFYALSCPCCDNEAYYWYLSRMNTKNVTFANLWINANYPKFKRLFPTLKRDAILIANYRAKGHKIGNLNILKHYEIDDDCISFWEKHAPKMIQQIKDDFGDRNDLLYVVSAGPMSGPIIERLYKNNPNNCYVDFGSSIDIYYRENISRPYMHPDNVYAKRNCWMYNPYTTDLDVSVVLSAYKRIENLPLQLDAIEKQSLKPREILLFQDGIADGEKVTIPADVKKRFNIVEVSKTNQGVWARFDFARKNAKSKYVCVFDDDTIPGPRWLENCMTEMQKREGLYGTIGILCNTPAYYAGSYTRIGWGNPNNETAMVDFVGHSWFLQTKWLDYMFENTDELQTYKICGEDMTLSQKLQEHGIATFVPPHPQDDTDLWGSLPAYSYKFGDDKNSLFVNNGWTKMRETFDLLVKKYKFKLVKYNNRQEYKKSLKTTATHKTGFWKNVFSIDYKYVNGSPWKVLTIFGIDIKIRKK